MRFATTREIEYLNSMDGQGEDANLVREMARRLDALRRYDQYVREADWRPRRPRGRKRNQRFD